MLREAPELTRKMAMRPTLTVSQGTVRAGSFLAAAKMRRKLETS